MARLNSAWGVFLSVAVSAVVGYAMLLVLTLHVPDIAATVDAANAPAVLYLAYANLPAAAARGGDGHRRGDVAVRSRVDHQHEPHVVRLRARRRHARAHPDPPHPPALAHAGVVDRHHLCAGGLAHRLRGALLGGGRDQHDGALPRLCDSDLSQPAQQAARPRRVHDARHGRLEPRPLGHAAQCVAVVWVACITVLFSIPPNELAGWSMLLLAFMACTGWPMPAIASAARKRSPNRSCDGSRQRCARR